ncbi:MAG: hypothetical protein ABFC85_10500 [Rectinema sp.]|jgi:chromosome segregation ATPase|uniref:Uncharacterized protein n=1 Tax=uncultured spirochete TaxID=156406 RepID=A0A3P3XPH5_9SPIR|nr:hypothetical protein SPIRO4BDMA_40322 [uncultured spirochete]
MLFSAGNLVTLVIVAAMFGVYHLLTADNRSLEKLKRLGDKLKDELGSYVESKSEEIKHYGIDLDVQQKAAKVVLEKIQDAQATIDEKSDSITEIANRFKEYDNILAQLMDMTKRVDQNIAHLAEKNNFIEELARRVENADKKMNSIETEMPKVEEQFAHDAKQILDGFRDDILDQLHEQLTGIVNMFEKSKTDAQSAIAQASSLREQIDRMTETALEAAASRAHNIEDSAYSALRTHIAANFDELSRQTEERVAALSQNLDTLSQTAETKLSSLAAATSSQVSDTDHRLSEAKAALNAMTTDMARIQKETAETSTALSKKFKAERDSLEEQFAQFGQAFEAHRASFEKEFLDEISTLRARLEEAQARTEDLKTTAEGNISTALGTFEEDVAQKLESSKAAMDEQIDSWLSSMDAKMRKISQDALEQRKTEEARLAQEVNTELKRLKDSLYTQAQKIERDIEAFKDV